MPDEKPRLDYKAIREGAGLSAVGLEMGFSVIIGYLVGYYLDKWLGTAPILTIVWIGFGLIAAGRAVWDAYQKARRVGQDEERPPEA